MYRAKESLTRARQFWLHDAYSKCVFAKKEIQQHNLTILRNILKKKTRLHPNRQSNKFFFWWMWINVKHNENEGLNCVWSFYGIKLEKHLFHSHSINTHNVIFHTTRHTNPEKKEKKYIYSAFCCARVAHFQIHDLQKTSCARIYFSKQSFVEKKKICWEAFDACVILFVCERIFYISFRSYIQWWLEEIVDGEKNHDIVDGNV